MIASTAVQGEPSSISSTSFVLRDCERWYPAFICEKLARGFWVSKRTVGPEPNRPGAFPVDSGGTSANANSRFDDLKLL